MEEQIKKLHGKKIPIKDRSKLADQLPTNMHIDSNGIVRYRCGLHPNSRRNLKTGAEGFQLGRSGFEGRRHLNRRFLRDAFQSFLNLADSFDGRSREVTVGLLLATMHLEMLKKAFKRNNFNMFSRLLADLRIFSDDSKQP